MENNIEKIINEKILFSAKQDKRYSSNKFCIMSILINIIAVIVMYCLTRNIGGSLLFLFPLNILLGGIFLYTRHMEDKYLSSNILWAVSKNYFYQIENNAVTFKIKRENCYRVSGTIRNNSNIICLSFKEEGVHKELNMLSVNKNNITKRALALWINASDEELDNF